MKNFFLPFAKFAAVAACALTLGSCNRAEYAMLPKGGSYHGATRVATPVPAKAESEAQAAAPTMAETSAPAAVAAAPTAPAEAAATATPAAIAATAAVEASSAVKVTTAATTATAPAPKLNVLQRVALSKATRKLNKLVQGSTAARQHDNTASTSETSAISGNLRIGIVLLLVGLLVGIFSPLIGTIVALIGVIFIVLWLLDSL